MVFWFYIGLFIAVPPLLIGLVLAVMYLCVRNLSVGRTSDA